MQKIKNIMKKIFNSRISLLIILLVLPVACLLVMVGIVIVGFLYIADFLRKVILFWCENEWPYFKITEVN